MISQLDLSSFSEKTVSLAESTKDFRPWDKTVIDWEIKYHGYVREEGGPKGVIECHVTVEIKESAIQIKSPKTHKKFTKPGYKLSIYQDVSFAGKGWENNIVYEEEFEKKDLNKAFDVFQRELLNVQGWVEIAESRARLIPKENDVFECIHCGWVTDIWSDDITCEGCGKRYWSERFFSSHNTKTP
jgi:hypothetical protein